jgi:hypothetical protein
VSPPPTSPRPRVADPGDAAAVIAWTGSLRAVVVHVLPQGSDTLDVALRDRVAADLFRRRIAGVDLEVRSPRYVPIAVALRVRLLPGYDRRSIRARLEAELGAGVLPDGRTGLFHRDGYAFGQSLYLSPIISHTVGVAGVASVEALRFQRWDEIPGSPAPSVAIGETEIARVSGDVARPERGLVDLEIEEAR